MTGVSLSACNARGDQHEKRRDALTGVQQAKGRANAGRTHGQVCPSGAPVRLNAPTAVEAAGSRAVRVGAARRRPFAPRAAVSHRRAAGASRKDTGTVCGTNGVRGGAGPYGGLAARTGTGSSSRCEPPPMSSRHGRFPAGAVHSLHIDASVTGFRAGEVWVTGKRPRRR